MESFIINHGEAGLLYRLRAAAAAAAAAGGSLRTAPAVDGRLRHWPIAMRTSCSGRHGVDDMHTTCRQRAADNVQTTCSRQRTARGTQVVLNGECRRVLYRTRFSGTAVYSPCTMRNAWEHASKGSGPQHCSHAALRCELALSRTRGY